MVAKAGRLGKLEAEGVRLSEDHSNPGGGHQEKSDRDMLKPQPFPLPFLQRELQRGIQILLDASNRKAYSGASCLPRLPSEHLQVFCSCQSPGSDHHPSQAGDGSIPGAGVPRTHRAHLYGLLGTRTHRPERTVGGRRAGADSQTCFPGLAFLHPGGADGLECIAPGSWGSWRPLRPVPSPDHGNAP